ncbi:hypothetical protein [Acinetobacter variabilis]|uniref:hypothetical protein n=1 Tax=Acinetobacter variabilis TaxID=70346 RepID=UPI0028A60279|nr:hypothetical protein [Acinetobacter variabilis]
MNIDILLAGFDASQIEQIGSIFWLAIGALVLSVAVGVYTFLQMRKMQKKNQPKPNQLDGTIADEGISFYDLAGSPHVHTNITDMWDKTTSAIKQKSGGFLGIGSSSQVTGYRYYAKFAAFIGNRIEKLLAINFDNRGWIVKDKDDASPYLEIIKPSLYGENEGGVAGIIDIEVGTPDQEPNKTYQKYFPLVSGYPYQSYLVFRGLGAVKPNGSLIGGVVSALQAYRHDSFYLGNSGYMKEMLLWVKRTRVRNDGREQWYKVRGDGAVVCEIDATLIPRDYLDLVTRVEVNPPQNKWYGTSNQDDQYHEFTQKGLISGYVHDFYPQFGGYGKEGRVKTTFPDLNGLVVEIEIWGDDGISFFDWRGGGFTLVREWSQTSYITCRKYWIIFDPLFPDKSLSFGITDQIPAGSNSNHKCVIWARLVLDPWTGPGNDGDNEAVDINPIHKIREILTDDTAMSKPEADINDANFMKAADQIWNEGLGVSWAIDEKSCLEAIEELCYHVEAGIRVNRQTGLYEMVLFRDDWFEENEIHDISENKIKDLSLEVMNSDDIVNQLNVTYYDRERIKNSTFSVYENGSILTMGHANAESVEFPYFMNMRNAEIVSNWKLKQFSTPAWSGSFTTGWKEARKWNRYDLIRLPWSSKWNGTILVRIMKINLGNGTDNTVTIDFEEVIPYSGEMNTSIVVDSPVDSGIKPPQPSVNAVFEAPYYLTVLRAGQTSADLELSNNPDIGYVAAIAAKPQSNSLNALLYTDGGTGEFEQVSRLDYCEILQLDQPIIETTASFTVTGVLTQTANSNNLILLNDELMGFVSFDTETKVLTVKRGVLDTIPKKHNSGNLFVFDLPDVAFDSTQYAQSEIVEAQVLTTTPSGIQELAVTGMPVEIQARAIRPYPPANVKINGEYFPVEIETDLVITWVDRNRIQQTGGEMLGWFDAAVMIEPSTQTHLILTQLDENDIELATTNANVTGTTSYTMSISTMQANTRFVKVTIKTVRDGYECLNPFAHTVELSQFFSAPYDLTVEFKND